MTTERDISEIEYLRSPKSIYGWHHVALHKKNKLYQVYYKVKNHRTYIGSYKTAELAAWAYHDATKDIVVDEMKTIKRLGGRGPTKEVIKPKKMSDFLNFAWGIK